MKIFSRFPTAERVQLDLLREKFGVPEDWINEIKENWKLDEKTGFYFKPFSKYDVKFNTVSTATLPNASSDSPAT